MTRRTCIAVSVTFLVLLPWPAFAINCTISTVGVNFGNYNVFSPTALTSTGSVTYRCTGVGGNSITVDLSRGNATSYQPRTMLRTTEPLSYNLYLDAGMTQIWGNNTGGTQHYGPTVPQSNRNITVTIFGRLPAGQDVTIGNYTDTIVATINF